MNSNKPPIPTADKVPPSNFLRSIIDADLARGAFASRVWAGNRMPDRPDQAVAADPARIRTRFPPEPNGYLHIGHAKSICLNFGLADDYDGVCHMRFDDTNPAKEEQEYVDSIQESIKWLGFDWRARPFEKLVAPVEDHLYFASDYFELLYEFAEYLIEAGCAYVDSQSADATRAARGTLTEAGVDSPFRNRTIEENLALFRDMRAGLYADGEHVLRARIDMASPNINMRDPVIYRIRRAHHHRTGDAWCIYPMYDYTHCISDALENITHSICTLEFEDHRPLYDWILERIVPRLRAPQFAHALDIVARMTEGGIEGQKEFALHCHNFKYKLGQSEPEERMRAMFASWEHHPDAVLTDLEAFFALLLGHATSFAPLLTHALDERMANPFGLPHQHEFARLKVCNVVTSKRKLLQLVTENYVDGWDDPRMPTLDGLRRRGYTPSSIRLFCERLGVSKADSWIDYSILEGALRDDLDPRAPRATAVLNPVKLIIDNFEAGRSEACRAPVHPRDESMGVREFRFTRELWIEAEDFTETPPKGYFRLFPGNRVRLRHGYIVECTGCDKDTEGNVVTVHASYLPETKSGTPGADSVKVKGNIHWISCDEALEVEVRLFDRLFTEAQPDAAGRDYLAALNPASKRVITAFLEPHMASVAAGTHFQFERHGYFISDARDHTSTKQVYNRAVTLKDSWGNAHPPK